jgi:hypothetical protein
MTSSSPRHSSPFLNTGEAGQFLGLSPRTLEKHRVIGGGPRFRKLFGRVLYALADLQAWADSRVYSNTSEIRQVELVEAERIRGPEMCNERPCPLTTTTRSRGMEDDETYR